MTDPLHREDSQIDKALGKDWPAKGAVPTPRDVIVANNVRWSAGSPGERSQMIADHVADEMRNRDETIKRLEAELVDRAAKGPVRLCLSREDAIKIAEAWTIENNMPPDSRSAVMLFIYDTYPVAREAGKIWETEQGGGAD